MKKTLSIILGLLVCGTAFAQEYWFPSSLRQGGNVSGLLTWTAGQAITAESYQWGRNADGINLIQGNLPAGTGFELSVSDTSVLSVLTPTAAGITAPDIAAQVIMGDEYTDTYANIPRANVGFWYSNVSDTAGIANNRAFVIKNIRAMPENESITTAGMNAYAIADTVSFNGGTFYGGTFNARVQNTGTIASMIGTTGSSSVSVGHNGNIAEIIGTYGQISFASGAGGGGTASLVSGISSYISKATTDATTVPLARNYYASSLINSAVADFRGMQIDAPGGAGAITTNYGIYIADQNRGTTDYGLYIEGADDYGLFVAADGGEIRGGLIVKGNHIVYNDANTGILFFSTGHTTAFTSLSVPAGMHSWMIENGSATGGVNFLGTSNGTVRALYLQGWMGTNGAVAQAPIELSAAKEDGAGGAADMANGEILVRVTNRNTTRLDINGNGDTFFTGLIHRKTTSGITASTTQTQGQGDLSAEINEVSTVANTNDTVTLPSAFQGKVCVIINNGANTLQIFPASGDNLGAGVDTATTLASGANVHYVAYDATNWESI